MAQLLRASFNAKGKIIGNEKVEKFSLAEKNDTVFMSKSEIEDVSFLSKVNVVLAKNGLTVVTNKAVECKGGNYRTFIGAVDYVPFATAVE
ncbi:MAG: hypothetical protein P4L35_04770 [Ignavibacteriaceae bacterium]|jgi:hypothetical protein|nr:hypothetical protein [Ignavibacteriaceae bacterium]